MGATVPHNPTVDRTYSVPTIFWAACSSWKSTMHELVKAILYSCIIVHIIGMLQPRSGIKLPYP
jgi:hypothetical protein